MKLCRNVKHTLNSIYVCLHKHERKRVYGVEHSLQLDNLSKTHNKHSLRRLQAKY